MKKHSISWWLFIGWWWLPTRLIIWDFPVWVIKTVIAHLSAARKSQPVAVRSSAPPQPVTVKNATITPHVEPAAPSVKSHTHKVAGISYRTKEIQSLGIYNNDYKLNKEELVAKGRKDQRVYEYDFYPVKVALVPEPNNPQDPNAIMVMVDGVHIGYIKAGSCAQVHRLLREDRIERLTCEIRGGRYKYLESDCDEFGNDTYTLEKKEAPLYARLTIVEK